MAGFDGINNKLPKKPSPSLNKSDGIKKLGNSALENTGAGRKAQELRDTIKDAKEAAQGAAELAAGNIVSGAYHVGKVAIKRLPGTIAQLLKFLLSSCIMVLAFWIFVVAIILYPPKAEQALANETCAIVNLSVQQGSYYQIQESPYYTLNSNGGSPRDAQYGNKDTIELLTNVGKMWSENHPDQLFSIGDINSSGHESHKQGIDVDIYNNNNKLFMENPGHAPNPNYDRALTIELAKKFFDTQAIDIIGYSDKSVVDEINKYLSDHKIAGTMALWEGHGDHFHVRVKKGVYECTNSTGAISGVLDVPYQNQFDSGLDGACAITSLAMVANYYNGTSLTDRDIYNDIGIMYQLSHLNRLVKSKGITFTRYDISNASEAEAALKKAQASIAKGNPVIVRTRAPFAEALHTMVITGFDNEGNVYVNDPNNFRGVPPYIKTGKPKGKNNLAPREKLKGAMIYIDYVK